LYKMKGHFVAAVILVSALQSQAALQKSRA
jgi:hypothetical protein